MMGLPDGQNVFKLGLAVETQYRRVTDRQTDRHHTTAKIGRKCTLYTDIDADAKV